MSEYITNKINSSYFNVVYLIVRLYFKLQVFKILSYRFKNSMKLFFTACKYDNIICIPEVMFDSQCFLTPVVKICQIYI